MKSMMRSVSCVFLLGIARAAFAATPCDQMTALKLPSVSIRTAAIVAAANAPVVLPEFCQVLGSVRTPGLKGEPDNKVNFEVDLPTAGWNGKLYFAGGGGFAAGRSVKNVMTRGYASAYTDAGHENPSAFDATWASNSYTKKVDFFYRGIHAGTEAAKAVAKAFYAAPLERAYFNGCSTGGRQALMEAQRYPNDFDGIIAGAPAVDFTGLMLEFTWNQRALLASKDGYIPAGKLPAIAKAVLNACDAADGLKDGLISDPLKCRFDPGVLKCSGGDSAECLTAPQVETLKKLYAGPSTAAGVSIFPGMPIGHEDSPNYAAYVFGGTQPAAQGDGWLQYPSGYIQTPTVAAFQFAFQEQFLKYEAFEKGDDNYDWRSFNFDKDLPKIAPLAKLHNALDPNLKPFQQRGGKLILYSGWADPVVPPLRIIQYYQKVISVMGDKPTHSFARLYLAPGMNHCGGGPGPNQFDALTALEQWVEHGAAPDQLIATHQTSDRVTDRSRPLCPYPQMAVWTGKGSQDEAENFVCK